MNKSDGSENSKAVRRWRARQKQLEKDRLRKSERRAKNDAFKKKEQEANRIRNAERRANDSELRKREREAIAKRREEDDDFILGSGVGVRVS